ncbi:MAG: hypothetical protein ACI9JN_002734 [Bacteroidia bacterium]|jgi:hypothetical protein
MINSVIVGISILLLVGCSHNNCIQEFESLKQENDTLRQIIYDISGSNFGHCPIIVPIIICDSLNTQNSNKTALLALAELHQGNGLILVNSPIGTKDSFNMSGGWCEVKYSTSVLGQQELSGEIHYVFDGYDKSSVFPFIFDYTVIKTPH